MELHRSVLGKTLKAEMTKENTDKLKLQQKKNWS